MMTKKPRPLWPQACAECGKIKPASEFSIREQVGAEAGFAPTCWNCTAIAAMGASVRRDIALMLVNVAKLIRDGR